MLNNLVRVSGFKDLLLSFSGVLKFSRSTSRSSLSCLGKKFEEGRKQNCRFI